MSIVIFVIYLIASVSGMLLVKIGAEATNLGVNQGVIGLNMPWYSIVGMLLYIISFLLWMVLLNSHNLSYIYPISMGLSQALILIVAVLVLKEEIAPVQWIGIVVVLIGVVLINYKK